MSSKRKISPPRPERPCKFCGKPFRPKKESEDQPAEYCQAIHRWAAWNRKKNNEIHYTEMIGLRPLAQLHRGDRVELILTSEWCEREQFKPCEGQVTVYFRRRGVGLKNVEYVELRPDVGVQIYHALESDELRALALAAPFVREVPRGEGGALLEHATRRADGVIEIRL